MTPLQLGAMDSFVRIERRVVTENDVDGSDVENWVSIAFESGSPTTPQLFSAEVTDILLSRAENTRLGQLRIAAYQTRVRMLYQSEINAAMRVVVVDESETIYQIISGPIVLGRKERIEMLCERYSS